MRRQHSTPKAVTFPSKNELPRVGPEPTTLYIMYIYVFMRDEKEGRSMYICIVVAETHASLQLICWKYSDFVGYITYMYMYLYM